MADGYVLKVDSLGDSLWAKTYGRSYSDEFFSMVDCPDGGYAVVGFTDTIGSGKPDLWIIRFNASHDSIWSYMCGDPGIDRGFWISHAGNGSFCIVGHTEVGSGYFDVYLTKIDSLGNGLWSRTYGGNGIDDGYCVRRTADDGFILVGCTSSYGAGFRDIYIIKTDSLGNVAGIQEEQDPGHKTRDIRLTATPNPFSNHTEIKLLGDWEIKIFDVAGRRVREISLLPFNFSLGAKATWDGCDENGNMVAPGVYFLKAGDKVVGKVVKVK
jgi:hypothetical protein